MADFPAIADYAFLSDCEVNALVAPNGCIEWLCLPRPDSPSVFGALLDRTAGYFRFGPTHSQVPSSRRYLPGTMVLETTWSTATGWLVVHDALIMGPWEGNSRPLRYTRPPADLAGQATLVRTATCIAGSVDVELDILPLFEYGKLSGEWGYVDDDYDVVKCAVPDVEPHLTVSSSLRLGLAGSRALAHTTLREGDSAFAAVSWEGKVITDAEAAEATIHTTTQFWRQWLQHAELPDHPWRPYLERSALTLKGLSYAPSGALLAAATTSLPESPGGERNWDYRFTWIRDSAFNLNALFQLGFEWEAYDYFAFLGDVTQNGPLQIMYGVGGERDLTEAQLDHLTGYEGSRPVRTGNGAFDQQQHDVWGMILDSLVIHNRQNGHLGPMAWEFAKACVESAAAVWTEPDRGIWEIRGEPQHFTSSKVMAWVAVDRGVHLAAGRGDTELAERWREIADTMHADICANGVDERGVFVQRYGDTALDASVLLLPLMGFLPNDDKRIVDTVLAIADELTSDGLVLRYRVHETDDGLSGVEGSFTICSFWLVSALALVGEGERARALCEKLLSFASPLHLYAEEIDASSGRHLGNFPQAFTHLALIDAVTKVISLETQAN